ncbi:hypothetical protein BKH46_03685 [Helicobacter sp. 12S02634-8]|uniref:TolC family protein n=1 Tax=Helicobacter sp. 12S02634-8 TaxID=1476199 RepID=UPI000BA62F6F|nr:TolC family protein [Helicobacter sp. 12S02634-8]PAF47539.1 hypothetical protein BKH46_03685 [Helicobacter sp. 12S02634-8]
MKYLIALILLCSFALGLSIEQAIDDAIKNSDKIKSQNYLYSQSQSITKSKLAALMPKVDFGYIFSYNLPGASPNYFLNSFNLTGKYNLFNGFKDYYALKDSKQAQKTQNYTLETNIAAVSYDTKVAYISILQAIDTLKIAQSTKKLLEAQKQKAQQFYNQGFRSKNEVLSVEVLIANADITLKSTQLNLQYFEHTLKMLTGVDFNPLELQDIALPNQDFDRDTLYNKMLSENPDYLYLQSLLASANIETHIAKGAFLPIIDLVGTKFWYINGGSIARTSYALQSQARIVFSWNIFNGLSDSYNYQAKKLYYLSLASKIDQYKKDLRIQIDKIMNEFELAKEQFKVATIALKQAEENYRIINNRYAQNIATYTELLNAQYLLSNAKTNITQSKYEIAISLAKIDRLLNTNSIHSIPSTEKNTSDRILPSQQDPSPKIERKK